MQLNQKFNHLPNAPIVEAVFAIKVEMPLGFDVLQFDEELKNAFEEHYPTRRKLVEHSVKYSQSAQDAPSIDGSVKTHGFRFDNKEGNQVLQVRGDGLSFNRLKPYLTFEDHLPELKKRWEIYQKICGPELVRRIGLRYINRIFFPREDDGVVDLKQYVKIMPIAPNADKTRLTAFMSQVQLRESDPETIADITLVSEPAVEDIAPVILDIDTHQDVAFEPLDDEIWNSFERLRSLKNRIFRESLSEACLQQYL